MSPTTIEDPTAQGAASLSGTANTSDFTLTPSLDIFAKWLAILDGNKTNYVDVYTEVMQKYTEYMADIADLVTAMANATKPGNDKDHVNFDGDAIREKIFALVDKYNSTAPLFTSKLSGADGKAEAEKWAKELGLDPEKTVIATGKDANDQYTYSVIVDTTPLLSMANSLKNGNIDIPSYQAMQAAIDAQKQVIQNTVQVLAEKFSKANSNYDSYIKAASSSLQELLAMLNQFLR